MSVALPARSRFLPAWLTQRPLIGQEALAVLASLLFPLGCNTALLQRLGPLLLITIDCGFPLVAAVTRPALEELQLRPGSPVTALLKVENLRTSFVTEAGVIRAVDGVDLELATGETPGLVGEAGSGQSGTTPPATGPPAQHGPGRGDPRSPGRRHAARHAASRRRSPHDGVCWSRARRPRGNRPRGRRPRR